MMNKTREHIACHGTIMETLKYCIDNSILYFQLSSTVSTARVKTLEVDLRDGSLRILTLDALPSDSLPALGIMGLMKLEGGAVLVLITKAKKVCSIPHPVFKVMATQLITHEKVKKTFKDVRLACLLHEALDVRTYGQHMYFSYRTDLTRSMQSSFNKAQQTAAPLDGNDKRLRQHVPVSKSFLAYLWNRVDRRFVFNLGILQPFEDAGVQAFTIPVIVGYVGQVPNPHFRNSLCTQLKGETPPAAGPSASCETKMTGSIKMKECSGSLAHGSHHNQVEGCITLVARMEVMRCGTRLWRKGLDLKGNNAHTFEVEQMLSIQGQRDMLHFSHLQVRGSIPALWSQPPNILLSPPASASRDKNMQESAFKLFTDRMLQSYQEIVLMHVPVKHVEDQYMNLLMRSLVEHEAHNRSTTNERAALQCSSSHSSITLLLAGEGVYGCEGLKGMQLVSSRSRLDKLWKLQLEEHVRRHGYFSATSVKDSGESVSTGNSPGGRSDLGSAPSTSDAIDLAVGHSQELGKGGTQSAAAGDQSCTNIDASQSYDMLDLRQQGLQSGVLHCSCWDAVDESLAVQQLVGIHVLEQQLREAGLLDVHASIHEEYPEVEEAVRTLWNHLGNITSDQVSGLGSLAGPAVKTGGDLPAWAWVGNHYFALERWFHGAFLDARKQDAIDLVTGAFKYVSPGPSLATQEHNYGALQIGALLGAWGLLQVLFAAWYRWTELSYLVSGVLLPLSVGFTLLGYVLSKGSAYVEQPQLCMQLLRPGMTE
ncbi:hypothetical protein CEUSTIGMA_g1204.t1 [Chlamydomonas eustigma]|uniref:SAC domain-containing protein n=1 Tax=Chlamydomonas eustigma TaxID=1157962 RepID=A0A250WSX1_9CHLO|nr:hypothetical protein CEUSTIGMA_g1204.t1 [Chlamydomonas eustigma]|eukprot:GAX73752.1 hypothetical protein CEUSTIGMA_g1204.t1 [Chlamydomonas eustigma]